MNDLLLNNAYNQHQLGNLGEAARLYAETPRANPKHPDGLCMLGLVHLQQGEVAKANYAAHDAIRNGGGSATASYNLGCLPQNLGRHPNALAAFNKALKLTPYSLQALIQRGVSLLALNDPRGAVASFDEALTIQKRNAIALNNRAAALLPLGRLEEAVAMCDLTLSGEPKNRSALLNRGLAYGLLKQEVAALASFDDMLGIDPRHTGAWFHRGSTLLRLKRHQDALQALDRGLAEAPQHAEALTCRAVAHKSLGFPENALSDCEAAWQSCPTAWWA
jgi:tetratricopeptide (TPR) repeat protein